MREGDILAYRRRFTDLNITVEKDVLVRIHLCKQFCG